MRWSALSLMLLSISLSGCGSVMSEAVLKKVDRGLTLDIVRAKPDAYAGRGVLWGGIILASENMEDSTEIEVLETELFSDDTPQSESQSLSKGRFIIKAEKFLDTAVFKPAKRVTVAGVVKGARTGKIGKMDYTYPVVTPMELKLFDPQPKVYIGVTPMFAPY
ncbi:MAG: Slp family lipoprotein [Deltaproteobacteria bacterium]|nr:Slp family lipoprotein [Deltaproteobacteria bacterium]